eukprot:jgi/Botrbrau1/4746/Bobra.0137s0018.1
MPLLFTIPVLPHPLYPPFLSLSCVCVYVSSAPLLCGVCARACVWVCVWGCVCVCLCVCVCVCVCVRERERERKLSHTARTLLQLILSPPLSLSVLPCPL